MKKCIENMYQKEFVTRFISRFSQVYNNSILMTFTEPYIMDVIGRLKIIRPFFDSICAKIAQACFFLGKVRNIFSTQFCGPFLTCAQAGYGLGAQAVGGVRCC